MYDSKPETEKHIEKVKDKLSKVIESLIARSINHDQSKLELPEKPIFDEYTPKLKDVTYGSEQYKQYLIEMNDALNHHYYKNRHHPEHFEFGFREMSLIDIIEMLMDWWAASERHADGDIIKSIEINQERFGYSDDMKDILINTINILPGKV